MFFLNLTAGEFFALFGALSALIAVLYLLDRAKRKRVVSTLRFWAPALSSDEHSSRKHVRDPWSLILQLLSLLLLLLAISQLEWGRRGFGIRNHVLLLDTSAWSADRTDNGTLLKQEVEAVRRYLNRLPESDRAMLVRASDLVTPATSFTADRKQLLNELFASRSDDSALNIEQALSFSQQAQKWPNGQPGEIVYFGPGKIDDSQNAHLTAPNLRTILIKPSDGNCGIPHIGVKRSEADPLAWSATIAIRNYGPSTQTVQLKTQFAGTPFPPRIFRLMPGEERGAELRFTTYVPGRFVAQLSPGDALPADDRASLDLPRSSRLRIAVFTSRPSDLKPLLLADSRWDVAFFSPDQYRPKPQADIILLDRLAPSEPPALPSLWIQPPRDQSPLPVLASADNAVINSWNSGSPLGAGLHDTETHIAGTEVFQTFDGDTNVANTAQGPVVVARQESRAAPRMAVIGFDPLQGPLRFQVATPLLFANLLRWLSPDALQVDDFTAGHTGLADISLDSIEKSRLPKVTNEQGRPVPFTIEDGTLQVFESRPGAIYIDSGGQKRVASLALPDVAEFDWKPANAATGLPQFRRYSPTAIDLWRLLALLAAAALIAEWMLFGRERPLKRRYSTSSRKRQRPLTEPRPSGSGSSREFAAK